MRPDPLLRDEYEAQAAACLEAAAAYRDLLTRAAVRLTGSQDAGEELFQQNAINCHDAIQRGGFVGEEYRFYLLTSQRNLFYKQQVELGRQKATDLSLLESIEEDEMLPSNGFLKSGGVRRILAGLEQPPALPESDGLQLLADEVADELRQRFAPADRVAFRLHVAGYSCQDIADLTGRRDRTWVWRRIERMKQKLRQVFQGDWDALSN